MKKIILFLVLTFLIVGCAKQKIETKPLSKQTIAEQELPSEPPEQVTEEETLPQPPTGAVSVYKGFWMPTAIYYPYDTQSMDDEKLLKEIGANIVGLGPTVKINANGDVKIGEPLSSLEKMEEQFAKLAKKYYEEDIRIHLVIETLYVKDFSEGTPAGGPGAFPKDVVAKPGFLDKYNLLVEDIAKLAEKYKVEIFSPMNEPDMKLGEKTSSDWGQQILPVVRKHYKGKVLWKAAFVNNVGKNINYQGYDAIGIDISPGGGPISGYSGDVERMLDNVLSWAKRDKVPEVMFTEFGVWGGALGFDEDTKALAHKIVFEQGKGKVKGFIALDPPSDLDRPLKGTKTMEEIKVWFKEKLK